MLEKLNSKKNIFLIRKIATYIVAIIFVLNIFVSYVYAWPNYAQNFLNYKLNKVRYDVSYEVIQNEDGTKTYIVYNYDGDIYDEEEKIENPYQIIKLKKATSSILKENPYLLDEDKEIEPRDDKNIVDLDTPDMAYIRNYAKMRTEEKIDKNINYDKENSDIEVLKVGDLFVQKYYPMVCRKKSIFKIPKEIIKNIKLLDILVVFNVARNDMKPADMWKYRYIEDVYVNKDGKHKIETKDLRRTTCLELKYQNKYENVRLMRFEYHQANDISGYAYVDVKHILDREELIEYAIEYDADDIDRYIDNLDYKFISDEWMVSYDDGDIDFYLRKWVTYKINVYKEAFEKIRLEVGDIVHKIKFDDDGYVTEIS